MESYGEYLDRRIHECNQDMIAAAFMLSWLVGIVFVYFIITPIPAFVYIPCTLIYMPTIKWYIASRYKRGDPHL